MFSGIYRIKNLINNKEYIGSSKDIYKRLKIHLSRLRNNHHRNPHLQNAFNKYGENNFSFEPLMFCKIKDLSTFEQLLINELDYLYNITLFVDSPMRERKHKQETIEKMRQHHIGRKYPEFENSWKNPHNKGKKLSNETKMKISKSLTGKKLSTSTKLKVSKAMLGKVNHYKTLVGTLISPKNEIFVNITNMAKFAREHDMDHRRMTDFLTGRRTKWKGWIYVGGE